MTAELAPNEGGLGDVSSHGGRGVVVRIMGIHYNSKEVKSWTWMNNTDRLQGSAIKRKDVKDRPAIDRHSL